MAASSQPRLSEATVNSTDRPPGSICGVPADSPPLRTMSVSGAPPLGEKRTTDPPRPTSKPPSYQLIPNGLAILSTTVVPVPPPITGDFLIEPVVQNAMYFPSG